MTTDNCLRNQCLCFRSWDSFFIIIFVLNRLIYFNLKEEFPVYDIQGCLNMQVAFLTVTFLECTESVYFERENTLNQSVT